MLPNLPPRHPAPDAGDADSGATKTAFIQDYGLGYQTFGLPKLMGQVVGLLLYHAGPISLDDITSELQVSKGPVSQTLRRLRDHDLVKRIWVPGSRRDHYEAAADIFGQAFTNHARLQGQNLDLARKYTALIAAGGEDMPESFATRMAEMERFYTLMNQHLSNFLTEWEAEKAAADGVTSSDQEQAE